MKLSNLQIAQKVQSKIASCLDNGKEFSLSLTQIKELFSHEHCAYTGKRFSSYQEISWERINPFLDYVEGNVVLVTHEANQHKSLLDNFVKTSVIPNDMKIKLMRKALYQLEKKQ